MELDNLANNKLLMQYLAAAGADIGAGNPIGQNVNEVTQESIAAQSKAATNQKMMQTMSKLLGEGIEFKSDSKGVATVKGDLENVLSGGALGPKSDEGLASTNAGVSGLGSLTESGTQNSNPFSLGLTANDLAGLSPQDISQSLSNAINIQNMQMSAEQMKQKQATDAIDMIYKGALTDQAVASAEKIKPSIAIPGTDIMLNSDQYMDWYKEANKDERTASVKNYEYAQSKGYKGDFEQFQDVAKTGHQKDYEQAKSEGYENGFNQWMLEMSKAGAINLGDIVERKAATEDVAAEKYFTDPKGLVADVDDYMNTNAVRSKLIQYSDDPAKQEVETVRTKEKFIRGKLTASGGEIVGEELDGRTFVFTVKWPDGHTSEVRYAN